MKNTTSSLLYSGFLLVLLYLNLRLILTLPLLATTSASVWQSFVTSWRLTRWRTLRIVGMLILLAASVAIPVGLFAVMTVLPTVIADFTNPGYSPVAATVGLSLWQIGTFIAAAMLSILVVQGLVAMMRDWLARLPAKHQLDVHEISYSATSSVTASRRKRLWVVAAAVMVVAFGAASLVNYGTMTRLAAADQTSVIAHRGFVEGGVENTLPALRAADKAGSNRVEFDILQTKDLKFVAMHDSNLQRLAGINANVKDLTQAELMDITVRADGMEAKIPSLEQWIAESKKLGLAAAPGSQAARRREPRPAAPAAGRAGRVQGHRLVHLPLDQPRRRGGSEAAPAATRGRLHRPDQLRRRAEGQRRLPGHGTAVLLPTTSVRRRGVRATS